MLGDFSVQNPNQAQAQALAQLLATLQRRHAIRVENVYTHQEIRPSPTACPGARLQRLMDRLRSSVLAGAGVDHVALEGLAAR